MIKKGAVIIPARYKSSRFPGKPLVSINGKSMIQHVYERCVKAVGRENVYVATDNNDIKEAVELFGGQVVMTSSECLTGTDRFAEVNEYLDLDFLVNVQGDEPMVCPEDIRVVFDRMEKNSDDIVNCYCDIEDFEVEMSSVPKVVISQSERLIYMSRGGCPFNKFGNAKGKFKQVCIYGFGRHHLLAFKSHVGKTKNEEIEDIEILRFLDLDFEVHMIKVKAGGVAVDTPDDLDRVRVLMMEVN